MLCFLGQYLPNFNDGVGNLTKVQIFIQWVWVGPEILYLQPVPSISSQAAGPWGTGGREKCRLVTKGAEVVGGFQYQCVIRGKWTILTHIAQKFSKLLGFVSSTLQPLESQKANPTQLVPADDWSACFSGV